MKKYLLAVLLCASSSVFSQTLTNTLLGYQEPSTMIRAHATDENGNIYFAGVFRGALVVNNQTLVTGNGGDDIFLVKTNADGKVTWFKKFGGIGNDGMSISNMKYFKGALYLAGIITYPAGIGAVHIEPYGTDIPATCITKIDTEEGTVIWAKRTNLGSANLSAAGNIIQLSGIHIAPRGDLYFEQQRLIDSVNVGISKSVFLYIDSNGNFQHYKTISQKVMQSNGTVEVMTQLPSVVLTENGSLFFMIKSSAASGGGYFTFRDSTVSFAPNASGCYLFKTDTSFQHIEYRCLSASSNFLLSNGSLQGVLSFSPAQDSIYLIANSPANIYYTLDGFNVALQEKNVLLVLDSSLVTARVKLLNSTKVGTASSRLSLNNVYSYRGSLYYTGTLKGVNEAPPIAAIPRQTVTADLYCGFTDTVDLNGPSRSFLVKSSLDFEQKNIRWLGSSIGYEGSGISIAGFLANRGKIVFSNLQDDIWNPWFADTSLNIISGSMRANSDRGEATKFIKYFSDGSLMVVGTAKGKTALDTSSAGIVSSINRNDVFFVRLGKQNEAVWYKRLFSSFRTVIPKKIVVKNDKAYVMLIFSNPANSTGYNYVKLDTSLTMVSSSNYYALLIIDKNGTSRLLNMSETPIGVVSNFDVYNDGYLAVMNDYGSTIALQLPGLVYPANNGFYIAKMDSTGQVITALKYYPASNVQFPRPLDIFINKDGKSVTALSMYPFPANTPSFKLAVTNASNYKDTLLVNNPMPFNTNGKSYYVMFRTTFDQRKYLSIAGPVNGSTSSSTFSAMLNDQLYIPVYRGGIADSFYLNSSAIISDSLLSLNIILGIDSSGNYLTHKKFRISNNGVSPSFSVQRLSTAGNFIYASGVQMSSTLIDTISLMYAGNADALTVKFDAGLIAKRAFRLSSIYSETMSDCDVLNDSLMSFAYTAQSTPILSNNRVAGRLTGEEYTDLDENAYVGSAHLETIITGIPQDVIVTETIRVYPNPADQRFIRLSLGDEAPGAYQWYLYDMQGQLLENETFNWRKGEQLPVYFHSALSAGSYLFVVKSINGRRQKTVKLIVR